MILFETFNERDRKTLQYLQNLENSNESDNSFTHGQSSTHYRKPEKRVLLMNVKEGITLVNVISMLLVLTNSMLALTFIFFSSVYFLSSPNYFNLDQRTAAAVAGDLVFYSYPVGIVFQFTSGFFYSYFGRKLVIFFGFSVLAVVIVITPLYIKTIYPGLLICT